MELAVSNLMSTPLMLFSLIVFPCMAALCLYLVRSPALQSLIVAAAATVLAAVALLLVPRVPFSLCLPSVFGIDPHAAISSAGFLLLCVILYFGFRHHHPVIKVLSVSQIIVLAVLEFFIKNGKHPADTFYGDDIALMLVLVASIAAALSTMRLCLIPCIQAGGDHPALTQASRHRFFALLLLCLGAFNGMLLANDMSFFYFFFEVITLCSFLLIAQKGTPAAEKKAVRTLSMTSLAGLVFLLAMT
ncbi:MAG: hypothetical protein M0Z81_07420 [Deltaproteobacteria bacterium]|jgi:ech hydrogenase subunit A|nr:hypothetical protein [Deltaproteobacteria bacterium]